MLRTVYMLVLEAKWKGILINKTIYLSSYLFIYRSIYRSIHVSTLSVLKSRSASIRAHSFVEVNFFRH